ncbi:MAG: hydrolase [Deltaproteobacteria bacterium]|nr:hydrolase [Deltaproteobacteria bacterium]
MLAIENSLLVVIDIQDRLVRVMHEKEALLENLQKIIKGARILNIPMIVTEQDPEKLGATIPGISPLMHNIRPIHKSSFSCCETDAFMKELEHIKRGQVIVVGVESHVCVYQTTVDLIRAGYEVHIVTNCTSSRTAENRALGIERMRDEGAKLTGTEMVLFELLKIARGNSFREISRLVK